jgi:hypothetical protein
VQNCCPFCTENAITANLLSADIVCKLQYYIKCSAYAWYEAKNTVFFIGQNGEFEGSAEPGLGNGKCPH